MPQRTQVMDETSPASAPVLVTPVASSNIDATFSQTTTSLATTVLGASIVSFSDEFFASASNLLTATPPVHRPGVFVHTGAWYDGWETRRHNPQAFDWVVIKLGCVGVIEGVEIDTAFFNGNEAPEVALDACFFSRDEESGFEDGDSLVGWTEVLPRQPCGPSRRQAWKVDGEAVTGRHFTHLRLKMYPDGGIARLRVYGSAVPPVLSLESIHADMLPVEELSSALNGGVVVAKSDQHFGVASNLLLPGRGRDMGDGWETARSRARGHTDWVVCRLGLPGQTIEKIVIDTKDFRGNFPRGVRMEGWQASIEKTNHAKPGVDDEIWLPLFVEDVIACVADTAQVVEGDTLVHYGRVEGKAWTHVKMTIIPDGGVKRLRVFGKRIMDHPI